MFARVKIRTLRQLKLPLGVTRLPASAVRDLLKRSDRQPIRNKFGAVRTTAPDGREFHSRHEAERYWELRLQEMAGDISDLELQPRYPLVVNNVKVADYIGDFRWKTKTGDIVLADAKGYRTQTYRLKKRLVGAIYGIEIKEL